MPIVYTDTVSLKHSIHFLNDGAAAGFDAVIGQHGGNVIGENFVRVEDVLVVVHSEEINTFGSDGQVRGSGGWAVEQAGADVRDRLDDGGTGGIFDVVEHDDFGDGGVELRSQLMLYCVVASNRRGLLQAGCDTTSLPWYRRRSVPRRDSST